MNRILVVMLMVWSAQAQAQNLITNPSFEEIISCPHNHSTRSYPIQTKSWYPASEGTPDLFSGCGLSNVSTPRNYVGTAYPPDGQNYVGLYFGNPPHGWQAQKKTYREYLANPLEQPMIAGEAYRLKYYAKPATNSSYLVSTLSYAFTQDSIKVEHDDELRIDFQRIAVDTLEVRAGWYFIDAVFTA